MSIKYIYEFLGTITRLTINPLTERCCITLSQAFTMHYGSTLAGPTGVGKSDLVKDFGGIVGQFVLSVNASDGFDYVGLGTLLKGASQSGVWLCIDEVNRMVPEVLSVLGN